MLDLISRICRVFVVTCIVALLGVGSAAADDGAPADISVGAPPPCGDLTVASIMAAECFGLDESTSAAGYVGATSPVAKATALQAAPRTEGFPPSCRYHANVVFYAATEWLRVAQTLAADASPCADYWIHIPTLAADKTGCRINQAHQIRALGSRFHAMCEAHLAGWQAWVAASPSTRTWYAAGVELRRRMALLGFDASAGDTWSVNELTTAVRRGDGNARANVLEFLRGLYDGGAASPDVMGNVFVIGLAQPTAPTTVYKENLKTWFADAHFWREASKYVRFWGQEVYGDIRNTLVPGESRARRAENLSDYIQQVGMLADAGPDEIDVARSFLRRAHYPLANAAWGWPSAFGFTAVPLDTMKHYIGIQEFAIRHYLGSHPHVVAPTLGYAWQPRNHFGLTPADFRAQWTELLTRLASSIAESLGPGGGSQMGACGPPGEHLWCEGDYENAVFNSQWALLRTWD